jgi:2-amino-4-hydroxy-6-hydroxymethyldihydropteridine diphosphokinase
MPRVGIALGSNLGDRLANIRAAANGLKQIATPGADFLTAQIYQTEPRFCPPGSPDFLNTVIEIGFDGTPNELLKKTQAIEHELGRIRGPERNAPRTIDIDLLYFGDDVFENEDLTLPHPRIGERRFVLQPLAEIRPDLVLPGMKQTVLELLDQLGSDEGLLEIVEQ